MTIVLLIISIVQLIYIGWLLYNRPIISIQKALDKLKDSLIRLIVFYQSNYEPKDQIVLIKKWIDSIDIDKIPNEQLKIFKRFIDGL